MISIDLELLIVGKEGHFFSVDFTYCRAGWPLIPALHQLCSEFLDLASLAFYLKMDTKYLCRHSPKVKEEMKFIGSRWILTYVSILNPEDPLVFFAIPCHAYS